MVAGQTARRCNSTRGSSLILLAVYLPILLLSTLWVMDMFFYYRAAAVLEQAASDAASFGRASEIVPGTSNAQTNVLGWLNGGDTSLAPTTPNINKCLGSNAGPSSSSSSYGAGSPLAACLDQIWNDPALQTPKSIPGLTFPKLATVWNGYKSSGTNPIPEAQVDELPFSLYELDEDEPAYNKVQYLPMICIRRACLEPFNESTALTMNSKLTCSTERPTCWQSSHKADFDGDGREDIVLFRPNTTGVVQTVSAQNSTAAPFTPDFIVYPSGNGHSLALNNHGYFDLVLASSSGPPSGGVTITPAGVGNTPIPIVNDYDLDGISDYAVFFPESGQFKIAFSKTGYRVIGKGNSDVIDKNGNLGLAAIVGQFTSPSQPGFVVVPTGGTPGSRYDITHVSIRPDLLQGFFDSTSAFGEVNLPSTYYSKTTYSDPKIKPHRGQSAVFAAADYDRDGITEMGYLSFGGGNEAVWFGGASEYVDPAVPTASALIPDPLDSKPALEMRMNPFDLTVDASKMFLYYVDSVDGRIWRSSISHGDNGATEIVVNKFGVTKKGLPPSQIFPSRNVWEIPALTPPPVALSEAAILPAADRKLYYPRRIAIGPDNAMYIADMAGRIVRVYNQGNPVDANSPSEVIFGDPALGCANGGGCELSLPAMPGSPITNNNPPVPPSNFLTPRKFHPVALAIVPDPGTAKGYSLAVSSGYGIYLLKNVNTDDNDTNGYGPRSARGESMFLIAGNSGDENTGVMPQPPGPTDAVVGWAQACPFVDLDLDREAWSQATQAAIIAAMSCSAPYYPGVNSPLIHPAGAIVKISALDASGQPSNTFSPSGKSGWTTLAGNYKQIPSIIATPPYSSGQPGGTVQRRVNITPGADANAIDIFNPAAVLSLPNGYVLFINQWSAGQTPQGPFGTPPAQERTYDHNIYRVTPAGDVEPLTNPALNGFGKYPPNGPRWYAPYQDKTATGVVPTPTPTADQFLYTEPHESSVKNVPVAAVAGLAMTPDGKILYTSAPYVRNNKDSIGGNLTATNLESGPYQINPGRMGYITRISLNHDGDSKPDFQAHPTSWATAWTYDDTDIDGDGVANDSEGTSRSVYCAEIDGTACRVQDRIGNPKWYFFRLNGSDISLPGPNGSASITAQYVEFDFINSVGGYANSNYRSRPDQWATLVDVGNAPYNSAKRVNFNGPIAAPEALDVLVGAGEILTAAGADESYPDVLGGKQFLFPFVLSSLTPYENGIKPVRRRTLSQASATYPGTVKSGVLCFDNKTTNLPANATHAFTFDWSSYLATFTKSLASPGSSTDGLDYIANCNAPPAGITFNGQLAAYSALVLELDHSEARKPSAGPPVAVQNSNATAANSWPHTIVTGQRYNSDPTLSDPENLRQFYLVDHDGNGVRDPTWIGREVMFSSMTPTPLTAVPAANRTLERPLVIATAGLGSTEAGTGGYPYLGSSTTPTETRAPFSSSLMITGWNGLVPPQPQDFSAPFYPIHWKFSQNIPGVGFDSTKSQPNIGGANRYDGFIVALDYQPKIPNFLNSSELLQAKGDANKYLPSGKYMDVNDKTPFAVIEAAKLTIENTLAVQEVVLRYGLNSTTPQPGQLFFDLICSKDTNDPTSCDQNSESWSQIDIQYGYSTFGVARVVKVSQSLANLGINTSPLKP